jgi:hypothetical protein
VQQESRNIAQPVGSDVPPQPQNRFSSVAIAVFLGGAFAGGHLLFENLRAANARSAARWAVLVFAAFGIAYLWYTWSLPHDFLSKLLMHIPFALIMLVPAWFLNRGASSHQSRADLLHRSRWHGVCVGLLWGVGVNVVLWTLNHRVA